MKKIVAISASNSKNSINKILLDTATGMLENQVAASHVNIINLNIRDYPMPVFGVDLESEQGIPENVTELQARLNEADGFILAVPEHNSSMPAVFKNTIDWLSRNVGSVKEIFSSKPTLLLSTSPGARGGLTNIENLASVMPWWGADIKQTYSMGSFYKHYAGGKFSEEKLTEINMVINSYLAVFKE